MLLLSAGHERAHFAFTLASAAAAMGEHVVLFASGGGCAALLADWSALDASDRDAVLRARGVAGFAELREVAQELGVRLIACEAALRAQALEGEALAAGVEVAGVATFLESVGNGQIVSV